MLFTVLLGNKNVEKRESERETIIHGEKRGAAKREVSLHFINSTLKLKHLENLLIKSPFQGSSSNQWITSK